MEMRFNLISRMRVHLAGFILGMVALTVILVCLVRMVLPERTWDFPASELVPDGQGIYFDSGTVDGNAPGWYVDNSMEYGDVFIQTPEIDLPIGSYETVLEYQTDSDGSVYSFDSTYVTWRVMMKRQKENLDPSRRKVTLTNCYDIPIDGFRVSVAYGGNGFLIVNGISVKQTRAMERMILFWCFLGLSGYFLYQKVLKSKLRKQVLFAIGTAFIVQIPLLNAYIYGGVDLSFHLMRIQGFADGLRMGQIPVRIQPTWMNGYGYPVSVFYGDGILAGAGILRLIGFSLQFAYKLYVFGTSFLTYIIAVYCFYRLFRDERIAIVCSVLYTLAPFRMINIYDGATVGQYTSMTFLPLIFVGAYEILVCDREKNRNSWVLLMTGMSGIIQCHILTCEIVLLILGITCFLCWRRVLVRGGWVEFGKAALYCLLVNMWFIVPFLDYYMRENLYVNSGKEFLHGLQSEALSFTQLLELFPGYGGNIYSIFEGLGVSGKAPRAIGIAFIISVIVFCIEWHKSDRNTRKSAEMKLGIYCCIGGMILLYMSTIYFPWDLLFRYSVLIKEVFSRLQFSWRMLGVASLMFTVVAGIAMTRWKQIKGKKAAAGLAIVLLGHCWITALFFDSAVLANGVPSYIPDVESIGTFDLGRGEYLPSEVVPSADAMQERLWFEPGITVAGHERNGIEHCLEMSNSYADVQYIELPLLYYRGYRAKDLETGKDIRLGAGENGRVRLYIDGEFQGKIQVGFQEPVGWRIAEIVSLLSLMALGGYFFIQWGKRHEHRAAKIRSGKMYEG